MPQIRSRKAQGASSEVIRDMNRRVVLNLIRTRQPLSRADLARISGLQRSTVSLIVEELIEEQWVLEGPTSRLPRGRHPTFLRLNDERVIVSVDVRPSQTTIALADVNGKFASREMMDTPKNPKTAIELLTQKIQGLVRASKGRTIEGIGISLPGRIDHRTDRLLFAPNLGWRDVDLHRPLAKATNLDVELENAANACVLAAVWFDRMEATRDLVVVTVAEGIGTGILANGRLARGLNGMAGEFGHVPLDPQGPPCTCGGVGCWEVYGSDRAALRYYGEANSHSGELSFPGLLTLADQGDSRAAAALEKMAHYLGRGMRMIVAGLSPETIIVIGDLTRSWQRFGPVLEAEVQAQVLPGGATPRLIPVHEDGMARLRGTVALVLQKHFGSPDELRG
jgi:predicted NBD/HSP70 family sugar kinase